MTTSRTIPLAWLHAARGYGEVLHGLSRDGVELRAGVFNEREVRVAAGLTMTLAAVALAYAFLAGAWLPIRVVAVALFVEFLVRVTMGLGHSPMGRLARLLTRREAPEWVSAKPKRFAWTLALFMSLVLSLLLNGGVGGALPLAMFSVFVALMWCEAVLGLCLGCEIHGLMVRHGWVARDEAFEVCAQGACLPRRGADPEAVMSRHHVPRGACALGLRERIVGIDRRAPVLDGSLRPYVNLDNAASTPVLREVLETVDRFMEWYSSVHRGAGFKSRVATQAYEDAREIVARFVGANPRDHVVIFGKNATEAINKLSHRLPLAPGDVVLVSQLEHHSNDLPWRARARVEHIGADAEGRLDEGHLDRLLRAHAGRVKLVAVTGGSNVTGHVVDVHRLAAKAHAAGARILVDCAQLAPHRRVDMGAPGDPAHLDYVALSAHKMYAPFGTGALIGRRDTFERGEPEHRGGGAIGFVSLDDVTWAEAPDRDEAGSPNVVGAVALAAAMQALDAVGMDRIAAHEAELTAYALERLSRIGGLRIYGEADPWRAAHRLGVIAFNLDPHPHALVAAMLGTEFGIGVRSGCFCAQPYLAHLLGSTAEGLQQVRHGVVTGDRSAMPGMVRVSFGAYNTREDVDRLADALRRIAQGDAQGRYVQDRASGEWAASGWSPDLAPFFSLGAAS